MEFVIYGAGGFGREVKGFIQDLCGSTEPLRCFVDDQAAAGATVQGVPVFRLDDARERFPEARMVIAIGYTRARAALAKKAAEAGWRFATLVHPAVIIGYNVEIGEGTIVTPQSVLTTDVVVGAHVILNGATIGHDSVIDDFVTLAPGSRIAGHVRIRQYSFLAQGVTTAQGKPDAPLVIGENCTIGLNVAVTASVEPRSIVTTPAAVVRCKTS